jgi:soluble lytic murein transglycosylase
MYRSPTLSSLRCRLAALAAALCCTALVQAAWAQSGDAAIVAARDAWSAKDGARLVALRSATAGHPLAMWVDYWELGSRLATAQQAELDAFYARWAGSYLEDRLRNDWLLELGKRRDWVNFRTEFPRFRMNDDREVTCFSVLTRHLAGDDVAREARAAWFAQRDVDEGCAFMGRELVQARRLSSDDAWQAARVAVEFNRPQAARAAAEAAETGAGQSVAELFANPARALARFSESKTEVSTELGMLALMRLAAADPDAAAARLDAVWERRLGPTRSAQAWAIVGKQAALKLQPQALDAYQRAWQTAARPGALVAWSDETLAWQVRAALRAPVSNPQRWALVERAINAMSAAEQREPAWVYWKARAQQARARPGEEGDADRAAAREALESIASPLHFYGKLATEDLGVAVALPPPPAPLTDAERDAVRARDGLAHALKLISLGLRSEGVREWNFSLRGMADRELLAAAQWACEREVWDRCINTSDRTRGEVDLAQRFPMPFREQVVANAREIGVDPAYMYGLIRQESRFILDVRSSVGASGLMQLMPATARWTARKIGLTGYRPEMIADRDVNLRLGTSYLKLVHEDFGGSDALAAAAYNAGPSRSRLWREGGLFEPAAWAESIPFNETRDYVKKVLSNAVVYSALLGAAMPSLKARLGAMIGPPAAGAPSPDRDLP